MEIQAQFNNSENFGFSPPDMLMESGHGVDNCCFVHQQQIMQFDPKNIEFLAENNDDNSQILPEFNANDHLHQSMAFSPSFSANMEKQRIEFDQFINLQKERLRLSLRQQRKQQIPVLLRKYESRTQFVMAQKDEEIAKASSKTMELQEFLKRLEIESLTWQRIARENASMAASLNGTIQRLREAASKPAADDASSCCEKGDTTLEARIGVAATTGICKSCGSRSSRVVLLPCRHLCSCVECEVFLDTCPVCRMVKSGSIEALI